MLLRALEARDAPFVLALDELEHLGDEGAIAVLDGLLRQAPQCLHIALALPVAAGRTRLRSRAARRRASHCGRPAVFPRRDRPILRPRTATPPPSPPSPPSPVAGPLPCGCAATSRGEPPAADAAAVRDAVGSWIAARFWGSFAAPDREAVLDITLFDWVDRDLVDEVFEKPGVFDRVAALPSLAGLLQPARTPDATVYRLHPLLREHGAETMRRERPGGGPAACGAASPPPWRDAAPPSKPCVTPPRRGMRASPAPCCLRPAACNGGCAPATTALRRPIGCLPGAPLPDGRAWRSSAQSRSTTVAATATRGASSCKAASSTTRDPAFEVDRLLAEGILQIDGALPLSEAEVQRTWADALRIGALPTTSRVARGAFLYAMAGYFGYVAQFDAAVDSARRMRELVAGRSAYLAMFADSLLGELAMARGRVREARKLYAKARRTAHAEFLKDPKLASFTELMSRELAFERNRGIDFDDHGVMAARSVPRRQQSDALPSRRRTRHRDGVSGARDRRWTRHGRRPRGASDRTWHCARRLLPGRPPRRASRGRRPRCRSRRRMARRRPTSRRCRLPAHRPARLAPHGGRRVRADPAARRRRPSKGGREPGSGDWPKSQQGSVCGGRSCGPSHCACASATPPATARAHRQPRPNTSRHYSSTDYARPLLQAGKAAVSALERLLDADPRGPLAAPVRRLLAMADTTTTTAVRLDGREMAILRLLVARQDKEIARALGLSRGRGPLPCSQDLQEARR